MVRSVTKTKITEIAETNDKLAQTIQKEKSCIFLVSDQL